MQDNQWEWKPLGQAVACYNDSQSGQFLWFSVGIFVSNALPAFISFSNFLVLQATAIRAAAAMTVRSSLWKML
jgi:hypothetical protein